jgi:AraC-like DNA-binding protein
MSHLSRARVLATRSPTGVTELATRRVAPALQPFVREICGYRETHAAVLRRNELPRPGVVMLLGLGPPLRIARGARPLRASHATGFVVGLDDRPLATEHDGAQEGIELTLSPRGAARLLGVAPAELAGGVLSLGELLSSSQNGWLQDLRGVAGWDARFDRVEAFLLERLSPEHAAPRWLRWAMRQIEERRGAVRVRELARALGVSDKRLIALFRTEIGVAPKRLCRIVRFDALIRELRAGPALPWAERALRLGFADQAHLAHEVASMAGVTPTQLVAVLRQFPVPTESLEEFSPRRALPAL